MKHLKYILILLLFSITFYSQEVIKPLESLLSDKEKNNPNTYYKDTNNLLESCVGTWVYENGSDYFKIIITKRKVIYGKKYNIYSDRLIIKYQYVKNGVTKYYNINSLNVPTGANTKPSELESCYVKNSIISVVYYEPSFTDCHRRKSGFLDIQYVYEVDMPQPRLIWTRTTDEHSFYDEPCDNGVPTDNSDFLIPANMVLTKVN